MAKGAFEKDLRCPYFTIEGKTVREEYSCNSEGHVEEFSQTTIKSKAMIECLESNCAAYEEGIGCKFNKQ